jgi:hypothetical protein
MLTDLLRARPGSFVRYSFNLFHEYSDDTISWAWTLYIVFFLNSIEVNTFFNILWWCFTGRGNSISDKCNTRWWWQWRGNFTRRRWPQWCGNVLYIISTVVKCFNLYEQLLTILTIHVFKHTGLCMKWKLFSLKNYNCKLYLKLKFIHVGSPPYVGYAPVLILLQVYIDLYGKNLLWNCMSLSS